MSIKFRITKYLAVSALAMLLLGACSKNNIYIDLADPNEEKTVMTTRPAMTVATTMAILPKRVL